MIRVKELHKTYGKKKILSSINFTVEENTCIAIIGENGSGKTTLLRIMLDMIPADKGEVIYDCNLIKDTFPNSLKKKIGAYLDDEMLIEDLTGKEYLNFIANFYEGSFDQKIEELLLVFQFGDIEKYNHEKISNYSLGMKRKIALISVLLHDPVYLILDEPFSSLDFKVVNSLFDYLKKLKKNSHIILTSHVLSHVNEIADKVMLLKNGEIKFYGDKDKLKLDNAEKVLELLE